MASTVATTVYGQIKTALQNLNPHDVRDIADRPVTIGLRASSSASLAAMEDFLAPSSLSRSRRFELVRVLHRIGEPGVPNQFDVELCDPAVPCPDHAFQFDPEAPERTIRRILEAREDLGLPLARQFQPFRRPVVARVVRSVSKENAIFSVMTALPDIVPSVASLPWAVTEFASDTAFITMNQVRMAFLIAAASDRDVGYKEQRAQIAGIVGGALGWRALARELVGKIPFGAGLIPKAAVAYAGTHVMGAGLERFYRLGYGLTRAERRELYDQALERGKAIVGAFLQATKK